jgi:hypothetical protein
LTFQGAIFEFPRPYEDAESAKSSRSPKWQKFNYCLPAGVDVHVLDGNLLLALPSIALQCLGLGRKGSQQFPTTVSLSDSIVQRVSPAASQIALRMAYHHLPSRPRRHNVLA